MKSIFELTFEQLSLAMKQQGFTNYRVTQVWEGIYRKRVSELTQIIDLNEACGTWLADSFFLYSISEHTKQQSVDGTVKFLFQLHDGHFVETVLMRHKYGLSVCVTTQVGCNIGCSFCASGLLPKIRDLTSGEIVQQIMQVQKHLDHEGLGERVSHVVVMGIGEPFDNFDHLLNFLRVITDHKGLAIGSRHITVSTSGLSPKIVEFAHTDMRVNLAISLHAPTNELRTKIMKINRAIPLETLMQALDKYIMITNQKVTLEYILLQGVNDHVEHAQQLAELIEVRKQHVKVNLIPYNPVDEHSQYQRSSNEAVMAFYDVLKKRGIASSVRVEHGSDIDAACGQLRSKQLAT
jgi:23S rRNA (adenine2503-C2)-methyltransferase